MTETYERARIMLREIADGTVDKRNFTPEARWWSVTGQSFSIDEFLSVLAILHRQTIDGIVIDVSKHFEIDDSLIIEATSSAPLINGGHYSNRYLFLIHFRDNLIQEVREYNDSAHLAQSFQL